MRRMSISADPVITNLIGEFGVFTSPGYPDDYSNETDYVWIITVLYYNSIKLSFLDFETSCSFGTRLLVRRYL